MSICGHLRRFIEQQQLGAVGHGTRDGDTLLLAARQHGGQVVQALAHADSLQQLCTNQISAANRSQVTGCTYRWRADVVL